MMIQLKSAEKIHINPNEWRAIAGLSSIFSLRMLGLFMILPVFALYAKQLTGVTPTLIGIALGIYGLTQAAFQLPFGYLSDRFGRKPMVMIGLLMFCLGSAVAAMSNSIQGVIWGRSLQGSGAIGSVVMALLADLTRSEIRMRAMAAIGITIALSFGLAFILGPLLSAQWGVKGIFWITAFLGLLGILVLLVFVPRSEESIQVQSLRSKRSNQNKSTRSIEALGVEEIQPEEIAPLKGTETAEKSLVISNHLYFGVLVLHASLTALFLIVPELLYTYNYSENQSWHFYLPVFLSSVVLTIPSILVLEKIQEVRISFAITVSFLLFSLLLLFFCRQSLIGLGLSLCLFFTAFNCLEASLPAYISKAAPFNQRGKVLGIFSTLQFLGLFLGGTLGGLFNANGGEVAVIGFCVILALIWWVWILSLTNKRGR